MFIHIHLPTTLLIVQLYCKLAPGMGEMENIGNIEIKKYQICF
jgi:hypothetical protein